MNSAEYNRYQDQDFMSSLKSYRPNNLPEPFGSILKTALYV
jgi:hypothetical protein